MTDIIYLPPIEPIDFEMLIRALQLYKRQISTPKEERDHAIRIMNYFVSNRRNE